MWKFTPVGKKKKLKNPILIAGLPGIGNVGKITADFLVENLKGEKIYDIFSYTFPNSVFVREDNLVELISISIYHVKHKKNDLLFLVGDVQPTDEIASYEFCDDLIDVLEKIGCKEAITVGGIGLADTPEEPKIYLTGNSKKIVEKYKKGTKAETDIYGVVGPIIGVSGLLLGVGAKRGIEAACMLAETLGHPMYLGVKGAREILKVLSKKLEIEIDLNLLDTEIKEMESEILKRVAEIEDVTKKSLKGETTNYIG